MKTSAIRNMNRMRSAMSTVLELPLCCPLKSVGEDCVTFSLVKSITTAGTFIVDGCVIISLEYCTGSLLLENWQEFPTRLIGHLKLLHI
jgi:hypothetical protein